ncbi:MAG TPA: hypothetical protein VL053_17890, partial [Arachidicoccus sp.]|nr:hypothetical protein [Arachidicoccus sp.]
YLRMTDLQLGYRFKQIKKLSNLRLYGAIQNVFTLTKYKGMDPEISAIPRTIDGVSTGNIFERGVDNGSFPSPRTFMVGLQLSF